ncbi:MAG: hypothetical protein BWY06_03120 [Candidatus Latescibacteria bacterium ADurb.Bin168]|nr:MAG: hypothetical protein BWY06_03120 [Candidatus Latescibacteria bacterium ADurb.Bin168]
MTETLILGVTADGGGKGGRELSALLALRNRKETGADGGASDACHSWISNYIPQKKTLANSALGLDIPVILCY